MPPDESIQFYNRYSKKVETEAIYGEKYLKFIYGNPLGRLALWAAVKRVWFSGWYGKRMTSPDSFKKILPFIERYGLNSDDFLLHVNEFKCFGASGHQIHQLTRDMLNPGPSLFSCWVL